jgi:hypothetical protein
MAEQTMSKETGTMTTQNMTSARHSSPRRARRAVLAGLLSLVAAAAFTAPAQATQGIGSFEASISTQQAGAHPDVSTSFTLENPGEPEASKEVILNLPEGLFGNPNAITRCTSSDFALQQCPVETQAGIVTIWANYEGKVPPTYPQYNLLGTAPIYDVEPQAEEETARFGLYVPSLNIPISMPVEVRTGSDYGLRLRVAGISQLIPLAGARVNIWGFPAAGSHNVERFGKGSPGSPSGCPGLEDTSCTTSHQAGIAVHPLVDNPTVCTGETLPVTLSNRTYQDPGKLTEAEDEFEPMTGCEKINFYPVLNAQTTSDETDAPSGLDLELHAQQFETFALSPSQIRSATVTLPEGLTINPDAADGQTACSDAQAHFGTEAPASCPDNAKIGTLELDTPALSGPLHGSLYFGEPKPGNQYRIFLVADGFGIHAKLVGSLHPDPQTGQVTAVFDGDGQGLPQVPFESFNFHIFASQRGLLATPTHCATYTVDSVFVPWNDVLAPQPSQPTFGLSSGPNGRPCPAQVRPFNPSLVAGTSNPLAGAFSNFHLKLDREDGDQFLGDLNFTMPPGFTGSLRGISYCPESAIAAAAQNSGRNEQASPSCPASSLIGTTNVAAGPGTHPFHAVGKIYMAGPLQGAPLSLAAITPALAGPYDYGTQVVRVALHVNPLDAHVTADAEPVPSIIGGVPIRMRSIQVNLDREKFTMNPTNCSAFSIASEGIGDQGTPAEFSSYFHAVNCATLGFEPKMTIKQLGGKKATKRAKNPGLRFDLKTRNGDANIKSVAVTLPKAFAIDQSHLSNICSKAQLAAEQCAGRQAIGKVVTETPLLDAPLSGPAYAVSGFGKLPHVVFILRGQVTVMPEAESSSVRGGHLKTVVPVVPDAPVGHFRFDLFGGKTGYITNTRSLCASAATTEIKFVGQNGKTMTQKVKAKTACKKGKGKSKRAKR